jgi:hypothetical protein
VAYVLEILIEETFSEAMTSICQQSVYGASLDGGIKPIDTI